MEKSVFRILKQDQQKHVTSLIYRGKMWALYPDYNPTTDTQILVDH